MDIKLSNIPCETPAKLSRENEFGVRVAEILKKISFPNRDKIIFSVHRDWSGATQLVKMYVEVADVRNQVPMALSHERAIRTDVTDKMLAQEILIMLTQYVTHEFMEQFRYDGEVLADPHQAGRNEMIFSAITNAVRAEPAPPPQFSFTVVADYQAPTYFATFHQPDTEPKTALDKARALKAKRKEAFKQFQPKDWRDKKRAA